MPVTGIEAELIAHVDGVRVAPEAYWGSPAALMGPAMVEATGAAPLQGGGVLYFDQGVLEVVTPVIELGPGASARVVRCAWEQIGQLRARLDRWTQETGRQVRLAGFSTHYNVSFHPPEGRAPEQTVEKLALLLAHLLPAAVALMGANRRSTGVGVRPRGNRIEVTSDFTPDPALMVATATLVVGIVRGAMALPRYDLDVLAELALPTIEGVVPGKHASRRGWLLRDYHFPRSPFTAGVDARLWPTRDGRLLSLRALARETAWFFRRSLRQHSDAFSFRLLFSVLEGRSPSLLELPDRPAAYDDVGRLSRWGEVLPELRARPEAGRWIVPPEAGWAAGSFEAHVAARDRARVRYHRRLERESRRAGAERMRAAVEPPAQGLVLPPEAAATPSQTPEPEGGYRGPDRRRAQDAPDPPVERRRRPAVLERRIQPAPARPPEGLAPLGLERSRYEQVFQRLVAGTPMSLGGEVYRPVKMRGWYHASFRAPNGGERLLSIDDLLSKDVRWLEEGGTPR